MFVLGMGRSAVGVQGQVLFGWAGTTHHPGDSVPWTCSQRGGVDTTLIVGLMYVDAAGQREDTQSYCAQGM